MHAETTQVCTFKRNDLGVYAQLRCVCTTKVCMHAETTQVRMLNSVRTIT
jgi:hypothetical protein